MACAPFDWKCKAEGWLDDLSAGVFGELEQWVARSAAEGMKLAVTGWIQVPTPTINQNSGTVAYLLAYTYPIAFALTTISLLIMAGRIAWSQRSEEWAEIGKSLVTFVALTTMGVATVGALTSAGDSYAIWIISSSLGLEPDSPPTELTSRVLTTLGVATVNPTTAGLTGMVLVVGFGWMALSSIGLILLTFLRGVLLPVLAGLLPVAAALGINKGGRETLGKYLAWILAWVTLKPAAATLMAAGFWMVGTGNALDAVGGIALLGMTVFMEALFAATNVITYGGGIKDPTFLRMISELIGDRDASVRSVSTGRGGRSVSQQTRKERILTVAELAALAFGRTIVIPSGAPVILGRTVPWQDGPYAQQIRDSLARFDPDGEHYDTSLHPVPAVDFTAADPVLEEGSTR